MSTQLWLSEFVHSCALSSLNFLSISWHEGRYDLYQACKGRWTSESVTMLGWIFNSKGVTLRWASLTHPLELGAAVADRQLCPPIRAPGDCWYWSSASTDTLTWIGIYHRCLSFALLPISQIVLFLQELKNHWPGPCETDLEVIRVDLHCIVLSHPLLHHGGEADGAIQERLVFFNLLQKSVHLSLQKHHPWNHSNDTLYLVRLLAVNFLRPPSLSDIGVRIMTLRFSNLWEIPLRLYSTFTELQLCSPSTLPAWGGGWLGSRSPS